MKGEEQCKIAISKIEKGKVTSRLVYNYSDIVNYELLEDGSIVETGGALFGGTGAVVGGVTGHKHKGICTNMQIKITLNDVNNSIEYVNLIKSIELLK